MAKKQFTKPCLRCGTPFTRYRRHFVFCSIRCAKDGLNGTPEQRFWRKVERSDGCWDWRGGLDGKGYGIFSLEGRSVKAPRFSWVLANGPIPSGAGYHGTCVLHRCDRPSCVRPDHLFLGSNSENALDRERKGRGVRFIGEANPMAKITAVEVQKIRTADGSLQSIADASGVSRTLVRMIRSRSLWAHVQ